MAIKWKEPLRNGLSFGVRPKRWLQLFVVDLVFMALLFSYAMTNISQLLFAMSAISNPVMLTGLLTVTVVFIAIFVAWMLIKILVTGALIRQADREKEKIKATYTMAKSRYIHLLAVSIVIAILNGFLGYVPFVGSLLTILVTFALFFSLQSVMVGRKGATQALKESYTMFLKHMRPIELGANPKFVLMVILFAAGAALGYLTGSLESGFILLVSIAFFSWALIYSRVGDVWALVSIVSGIISLLFALPGLILMWNMTMPLLAGGANSIAGMAAVLFALTSNLPSIAAAMILFFVGTSIGGAFAIKTIVDFYKQLK